MWMEPSLAKHFPSYEEFNLVATTISTGYNEVAKTAGLPTRMLKLLPTARGTAPPKRMRIDHKGDKDDKVSPAQTTPAAAASSTQSASSSSKRPQQQKDEDQAGKRHRDSAQPQPHTNQSAWDWDWRWQSWSRHGYETGSQPWPRNHRLHWPQLDTASLCLEDGATRVITRQISNLAQPCCVSNVAQPGWRPLFHHMQSACASTVLLGTLPRTVDQQQLLGSLD